MASKENQPQYMSAYVLRAKGMTRADILENLKARYQRTAPHVRTLSNWITEFDAVAEEEKEKDRPFMWFDMDKYGLPWNASQSVVEHVMQYAEERRQEPTGRQAVWMWRVLQFKRFQDMPMGREQLLYRFVDRVVTNELQTILNQTPDEERNNISREAEQLVTSIPSRR